MGYLRKTVLLAILLCLIIAIPISVYAAPCTETITKKAASEYYQKLSLKDRETITVEDYVNLKLQKAGYSTISYRQAEPQSIVQKGILLPGSDKAKREMDNIIAATQQLSNSLPLNQIKVIDTGADRFIQFSDPIIISTRIDPNTGQLLGLSPEKMKQAGITQNNIRKAVETAIAQTTAKSVDLTTGKETRGVVIDKSNPVYDYLYSTVSKSPEYKNLLPGEPLQLVLDKNAKFDITWTDNGELKAVLSDLNNFAIIPQKDVPKSTEVIISSNNFDAINAVVDNLNKIVEPLTLTKSNEQIHTAKTQEEQLLTELRDTLSDDNKRITAFNELELQSKNSLQTADVSIGYKVKEGAKWGGDLIKALPTGANGESVSFILDSAGHGYEASAQKYVLNKLVDSYLSGKTSETLKPDELLGKLNEMSSKIFPKGDFTAFSFVKISAPDVSGNKKMQFFDKGNYVYVVDKNGDATKLTAKTGAIIGAVPPKLATTIYAKPGEYTITPSDQFVLQIGDGIAEFLPQKVEITYYDKDGQLKTMTGPIYQRTSLLAQINQKNPVAGGTAVFTEKLTAPGSDDAFMKNLLKTIVKPGDTAKDVNDKLMMLVNSATKAKVEITKNQAKTADSDIDDISLVVKDVTK